MKGKKGIAILLIAVFILSTLAFAAPFAFAVEPPSEVWVDDGFDSSTPDWLITCFDNIQGGADAVAEGGMVYVADGAYTGNVDVTVQGITIHGESLGAVLTGGFNLQAYDITIDGLTIYGMLTNVFDPSPTDGSKGHKIINNEIIGPDDGTWFYGIIITTPYYAPVETYILVDNNKIHGCRGAIMVEGSENTITNNEIYDNMFGIELESTNGHVIMFNDIHDNSKFACSNPLGYNKIGHGIGGSGGVGYLVNYNDIYDNDIGIEWDHASELDANLNWWGTEVQSEISTMVEGNVDFNPWLPADFMTTYSDTDDDGFFYYEEVALGTDPDDPLDYPGAPVEDYLIEDVDEGIGTVDATDDIDTAVDYEANEETTITVAKYDEPPEEEQAFLGSDTYIDVRVDEPENLDSITIKLYYTDPDPHPVDDTPSIIDLIPDVWEDNLRMYYWDGSDWVQCSDTGVNMDDDYIWAIIDETTRPDLSYLSGGPFGAGDIKVELDSEWYNTGDTVDVRVEDATEEGMIMVLAKSTTIDPLEIPIALHETETGIFTGEFLLVDYTPGAGELLVEDGDMITVTYLVTIGYEAWIDDVEPIVAITAPVEGDFVAGDVTITATIDEDNPVDVVFQANSAEIDEILDAGDTETITWKTLEELATLPLWPDDTYTITVTATDGAGNFDSASISVKVDNTPPSVTDATASPEIMGLDVESDLVLTATIVDAGIGVVTVTVDCSDIGGASNVPMSAPVDSDIYTATILGITATVEDEFNLTITATDLLSNVNDLDFIGIEVIEDLVGPYEVGFTEVAPVCGGLVVQGLYMEDLLTGPGWYEIFVDEISIGTVTETVLATTTDYGTFGAIDEHIAFKRSIALDLTGTVDIVNITLVAYDLVGTPADEIILYEGLIPEGQWSPVSLYTGWNLVSLPLIPDSSDSGDVLSLILDQGASGVIVSYEYDQDIDDWITDPAEMTDGYGYWLYMLDDDVMIVEGIDKYPAPSSPQTYEFTEGWVLAGYKATYTMDIDDYVASLQVDSYFSTVYLWDAETPVWYTLNTGTEDELSPGKGFWIWMYSDQDLIAPWEP